MRDLAKLNHHGRTGFNGAGHNDTLRRLRTIHNAVASSGLARKGKIANQSIDLYLAGYGRAVADAIGGNSRYCRDRFTRGHFGRRELRAPISVCINCRSFSCRTKGDIDRRPRLRRACQGHPIGPLSRVHYAVHFDAIRSKGYFGNRIDN